MIILLSLYVAAVCLVPAYLKFVRGNLDLFEPLVPAIVFLISLFSIRPLAMLVAGEVSFYRWINITDTIEIALMICASGVTSYIIGYFFPIKVKNTRKKYQTGEYNLNKLRLVCSGYTVVGLVLILIYLGFNVFPTLTILAKGRTGNLSDIIMVHSEYLFCAPILLVCAAILIIVLTGKKKIPVRVNIILLVLILIPIAWFYLMGVRRFIIPSILIPLLVLLFVRQKRPTVRLIVFGFPIIMILLAVPYMRTEGARSQIGGIKNQLIYAFSQKDIYRNFFLGPDTEMLSVFAVEVQVLDSPSKFYYGAATVGDLFLAPIPSSIFAKPMTARNQMLVDAFGRPCSAGAGGLCPDFSVIGTFYQDFWIVGVLVGMALMGRVSRRVWENYLTDLNNPFRIVNAAVVFVFVFIIIRAGFMPAFQWLLYYWVPVTVGLLLVVKRRVSVQ